MRDLPPPADPFFGNGTIDLPEPDGIAATWFFIKAQTGNTHPGACAPFGMISVCAYSGAYPTGYGTNAPNYNSSPPQHLQQLAASGFAHLHQSGTGAIGAYYNYLRVTPLVGGLEQLGTRWPIADEAARPGFYAARLAGTGIVAELTASQRAALHRYTFPQGEQACIAVDISAGGIDFERMRTYPTEADVVVISPATVQGHIVMEGVRLYYSIQSDAAQSCSLWRDRREIEGQRTLTLRGRQLRGRKPFGVVFHVPAGKPAQLRIAFSLHSAEQAARHLDTVDRPFEQVTSETARQWNAHLNRIELNGGTREQREVLYSSLYHSLVKPADWSGESPYWEDDAFYVDFATMWDQYKTQLPLVLALYPERARNVVETLISLGEHAGGFPNGFLLNANLHQFDNQARSLAHTAIADAHHHQLDGIDWRHALDVMVTDIRQAPNRPFIERGSVRPVTHTLDLAGACFCTAQLASALGEVNLYREMMALSAQWRNVYDPATGRLIEAKYYEGGLWNYSFRLLHDMAGRISLYPTEGDFVADLDRFFGYGLPRVTQPTDPGNRSYMRWGHSLNRFEGYNNEPDIETPYAYIYAGRHDRTAEVVRAGMRYMFTTGRGGLPGNNDSGGLTSCYVWNAVGLFPVTGQPVVLIGSPLFPSVTLHLGARALTIEARGNTNESIYVQRATLNDRDIDRAYLTVDEMLSGGTLVLEMDPQPSGWARQQRPPSFPT